MRERSWTGSVPTRVVVVVGVVSLTVAVSPSQSGIASESTADVSAVTLVERRTVRVGDGQLISLSPDGARMAFSRPAGVQATSLCIRDVATLEERACADVSGLEAMAWIDSVVWSPDSQWLAFAELWPMSFVDGDLWLMDASTGELTNLLDDGYEGKIGYPPTNGEVWEGAITLPSYPTFNPDSAAVTFSRSRFEEGEFGGTDVATVPIAGGEAVRVGDLAREAPYFDYFGKAWSADGSRLFVSLVEYGESGLGPESGIWMLEADAVKARPLSGHDDWPPSMIRVSPHGERLLVLDPTTLGRRAPTYALVDGDSGATQLVESWGPDAGRPTVLTGVMLSPDGSLLLTITGGDTVQVAVRDITSSTEEVLLTEARGARPFDLAGPVLSWADDDTVLVSGGQPGRGTLLVLERGDSN